MRQKKIIRVVIYFLALLFLGFGISFAAQPMMLSEAVTPKRELMMFEEIPIVTSASKHPESLLKAPAAISVITSEDIENMDYPRLWDNFRRVPGVDVQTFDGRNGGVAPRGFDEKFTRRNQILIDGRSAYSPLFGGIEWTYVPIFPEDIERIEVIRGPNAALYGSNAFTGVINIITKDPSETKGAMFKESIGNDAYQRSYLRYGGALGNLDYRLDYVYHFDRGFGTKDGVNINDSTKNNMVGWRSKYKIDDKSNVEVLMGLDLDVGRPTSYSATSKTTSANTRSDYEMIKYNTKIFNDQDIYFQIYHNEVQQNDHGDAVQFASNDRKEEQYDFEMQHTLSWLKEKIKTVWGLGFRYNGAQNALLGSNLTTLSPKYGGKLVLDRIYRLFFNNDIKLNDQWTYIFGAMFENNYFTGGSCSPRTSLMYAPKENHVFRLTYSRAFRTPTILEAKQNQTIVPFFGATITTLSPNTLKNEVVDAYELGYNSSLLDNRLKLGAQGYINKYRDLIEIINPTPLPAATYTLDNGDRATAKGIELDAEFAPKDWIKVYSNGTFEQLKDKTSFFKGTVPKFKVNLGSRFKLDNLGIIANFDGYYTDTYMSRDLENSGDNGLKVSRYFRFDCRIAKTFFKGALEWAIKGENLFGPKHLEARSGPASNSVDVDIERTFYTTLTAKF